VARSTQLCQYFVVASPEVPQQGKHPIPVRVWLIGGWTLLFGVGLVVLGGALSGLTDYERSILATVGTAVGLVAPLFLAEEMLRHALATTRSVVENAAAKATAAADRIDQVGTQIRSLLDVQNAQQASERNRAELGEFAGFSKVYSDAEPWLNNRGLWVAINPQNLGILVKVVRGNGTADQDYALLRIESADLQSITSQQSWLPNDDPASVLLRFRPELINRNLWPGDEDFPQLGILFKVIQALSRITDAHQAGTSAGALRSVVAVAGEWAVAEAAGTPSICHLQKPDIQVSLDELATDPAATVTDLKRRLGTWTADDDAAVAVAITLHNKHRYFYLSPPSGFKINHKNAS
jgi:hypothetical protein